VVRGAKQLSALSSVQDVWIYVTVADIRIKPQLNRIAFFGQLVDSTIYSKP
jgi:hypothetical protein